MRVGEMSGGASFWDIGVMTGLVVAGVLYAAGSYRMRHRHARVPRYERPAFWVGWSALFVAASPFIDVPAAWKLSIHMFQHELLMLVGAPLVIVGRPIVPWLWALPASLRAKANGTLQRQGVATAWRWVTLPIVAWMLHGLTIWIWHLPVLYEAAVRSEAIHTLQHGMFVATAIFFWWGIVYGRYGRAAYGASVLYVFSTSVHTSILGAAFALSTAPFYAVYRDRAAAAGVDALGDQQLAGLYMWIPAGAVLTLVGLALLVAWLSESERRARVFQKLVWIALPCVLAMGPGCTSTRQYERDARALTGGDPRQGRIELRTYGCDACHTIPGVPTAVATVGPPLTQIARRTYLAGRLPNTPQNMERWIRSPRDVDPETAMPSTGVTVADARDIAAYLYTLR